MSELRPAFYRLPVEILILIVKPFCEYNYHYGERLQCLSTLRALRLSCSQFAYLPCVQAKLFAVIYLKSCPEHVKRLETTDFSRITPYVRSIFIESTKYTWGTSFELFKEVVTRQAIHAHAADNPERSTDLNNFQWKGKRGYGLYVEKYMKGIPPLPEDEMEKSYETYMARANEVRELFDSGSFEQVLTAAFRKLSSFTHSLRISTWDPDVGRSRNHCLAPSMLVGDALFTAVLRSVSAVDWTPADLSVNCSLTKEFSWLEDPKWASINLAGLKDLEFSPGCYLWPGSTIQDYVQNETGWNAALTSILKKCQHSLTSLKLSPSRAHSFCRDVIALPNLETLEIEELCVSPRRFASFLRLSKSLRRLKLRSIDVDSGNGWEYKYIWNAIRHHENKIRVDLDEVTIRSSNEPLNMTLGFPCREPWSETEDIENSLNNYVSNSGKWNAALQIWFDGDEGDEDGSSVHPSIFGEDSSSDQNDMEEIWDEDDDNPIEDD
ncbi:hypothetical protein AJ79_07727 [Helicocarpus griseus UAMH5409]|uniref:Uncharacterized protein n=1 Tax=Helicocarpus griseus UAMH5409 TaxID=1447875 RepID=A0A2B7WZR6_9EURO|nr:hypothetical protein AJ79_07727 [Helicocarpus griseus UAMH5409]